MSSHSLELLLLSILMLIAAISLAAKLSTLQQDISLLRQDMKRLSEHFLRRTDNDQASSLPNKTPPPTQIALPPPPVEMKAQPPSPPPEPVVQPMPKAAVPIPRPTAPAAAVPATTAPSRQPVSKPKEPAQPSPLQLLWQRCQEKIEQFGIMAWQRSRRWLTSGNIPVRVGMLVLFAGIAALLKQLSAQGWLWVPLPVRLGGIALLATGGLMFGWQQRHKRHNFALALQGGMIAILMFSLFAAYRLYALIPSTIALSGGIVLMAGMMALSVVQRARVLTQLAILGCFAAPILMSSGQGHSIALFSYYALLDVTIIAIAWIRPWRELNVLGFIFTYGIGITKGVLEYSPEHWSVAEPFLWLFFAIYLALPLLYAYRAPVRLRNTIDASLIFGTPLITLVLQSSLVVNSDMGMPEYVVALSAVLMSVIYGALALLCYRKWGRCLLSDVYLVLAAMLVTTAIPLTFGPSMTRYIFVIEGAGLVWLGLREQRLLPRLSGYGLQLYAMLNLVAHSIEEWDINSVTYMHAIAFTLAAVLCVWLHYRANKPLMAQCIYGYALFVWTVTHFITVLYWLPSLAWTDAFIICSAITACGSALAYRHMRLPALMPAPGTMLILCGLLTLQHIPEPTTQLTWASNLVLIIAGAATLWLMGKSEAPHFTNYRTYFWLLVTSRISLSVIGNSLISISGMTTGLAMVPWLLLGALLQYRPQWLTLGRQAPHSSEQHTLLLTCTALALVVLSLRASLFPCTSSLPWLPLLNPAELGQCAALALLWKKSTTTADPRLKWGLGIGMAWLVNETLLHTLHHWWGLTWQIDEMMASGITQLSITLLWSIIGVVGWVAASRQRHHLRWRIHAVIMGIVLAKLLLIDRLYLGSLTGILSFVAYGLLCVLVGFLAPAPPHKPTPSKNADNNTETP